MYMPTREAVQLLKRLEDIQKYKKYTLSGIYDKEELDFIKDNVGTHPVIRGFDLMRYSPAFVKHAGTTDEVTSYLSDAEFVNTASWHWVPTLPGVNQSNYSSAFCEMQLDVLPNLYGTLRDDVDAIAVALKKFNDANVPLLWRPLHECSQRPWFWWSKDAGTFKALWNMMYDRLVHHHGLHNLLWVWNPAHNYNFSDASFYPGDDKVHVVAVDYPTDVVAAYHGLKQIAPTKPAAVAEASWNDWSKYISNFDIAPYSYVVVKGRPGARHAGASAVKQVYESSIPRLLPWS